MFVEETSAYEGTVAALLDRRRRWLLMRWPTFAPIISRLGVSNKVRIVANARPPATDEAN